MENAVQFISFDFKQAGTEIAHYLNHLDVKMVGVFTDEDKYSNEHDFISSLLNGINPKNIEICQSNMAHEYQNAFKLIEQIL